MPWAFQRGYTGRTPVATVPCTPLPRAQNIYINPEKPINAIAKIPAVINATGTPRTALGTCSISSRSRIPAKSTPSAYAYDGVVYFSEADRPINK